MIKHKIDKISPRSYRIDEFGLVNAFLIVGDEKAALIDTGLGLLGLKECIKEITDKEIVVLLTHGHPDHAGGAHNFKDSEIYMNEKDKDLKLWGYECNNAFRRMYVETRGKYNLDDLYSMIPADDDNSYSFRNIKDCDEIDLGGIAIKAIETPSHTEGSVSYLLEEERLLFSGDSINCSVILLRDEENSLKRVEEFNLMCEKLLYLSPLYDVLLIGHGGPFAEKSLIEDYKTLSDMILENKVLWKYEQRGFRKGDVARYKSAELWFRCDS